MNFKTAAAVEQLVWQMKLSDFPRASNRALLNGLYNGAPPYTSEEQTQNRITTNVNFLEGTKILHDARRQFFTGLIAPDPLLTVNVDFGPAYKKRKWSDKITKELNKKLKSSLDYLETLRSTFAGVVLHGIGPTVWQDKYFWCPRAAGIEDVLIPTDTLLSMTNLPFFSVYRKYTGAELWKKTHGPRVDPAWNMPVVEGMIKWVDQQASQLMGNRWPEVWSPEKLEERIKQDAGLYSADAVPTIDTFDFYYYDDAGKQSGWRRKIILDAWGSPGVGGIAQADTSTRDGYQRGEFLYDSGDRVVADKLGKIIHFQFADASCVPPFKYHSVRSLGFLLYAVCQLQNRLRSKFNDAVFEAMLQYFRVTNPADQERLSKVDLIDKGVIPEGLQFVGPQDRWQVNDKLAENGMALNRQTMADNSASFSQDFDFTNEREETATRTMAKVNATAALVGAMLNQAYDYRRFQDQEICRRFCIKNSKDLDVRDFRNRCLRDGIPEEALNFERWEVAPVRVLGSGNKMLQVAMADKLMAIRPLVDPEGQKVIDRIYILANSDDPSLPDQIIPEHKHISDSVRDAQMSVGSLLDGLPVSITSGSNVEEYVTTWLFSMAAVIKKIEARGAMATQDEIVGLNNLATHIGRQIDFLSQDKTMGQKVKQYSDELGKLNNIVKGYVQRLQEQQQQAQEQGAGGPSPESMAKMQETAITAQEKRKMAAQSHAEKTAQKQVAFEQQQKHALEKHKLDIAATDAKTAAEIRNSGIKAEADAAKATEKAEK